MPTNDDKLQQRYMQFQLVQQQLEEISKHVETLNQQNAELEISISAVQELGETEKETEILAPIANGIFFKSELAENKTLIVNVGSNVTVEKSIPDVVEILKSQQEEVTARLRDADDVLQQLSAQALKLYKEVERLAGEKEETGKEG